MCLQNVSHLSCAHSVGAYVLGCYLSLTAFRTLFFFSFFVWDFNVIPASDTISAIYPEGETTALSWATPAMQFPVNFFFNLIYPI